MTLEILGRSVEKDKDGCYLLEVKCFCGKIFLANSSKIKTNRLKSCGCLRGKAGTHHLTKHPMYARYKQMLSRCNNPRDINYVNYGARGITVCERWSLPLPDGFNNFIEDMGICPEGLSLDRVDNSKGYSKENCRWADLKIQANNKRNVATFEYLGKTTTLRLLAEELGLDANRLRYYLIEKKLSLEEAIEKTRSGLYESNKTGYNGIRYRKDRNRYYVDIGNKKTKSVKTLDEALKLRESLTK